MQSAVIGFPRIGRHRELKFVLEKYFRGEIGIGELQETASMLKREHWHIQHRAGISYISSNDFTFYDNMLDTAILFNAIGSCYRKLNLNEIDTYFAMARGYQGKEGDVPALAMKKWFNTNYHYIVPELGKDTKLQLTGEKVFLEFAEAKENGIQTKPVVIGAFTFLKMAKYHDRKKAADFVEDAVEAYKALIKRLADDGATWIQFDEPSLVMDLLEEDTQLFATLYEGILKEKGAIKILLQTYFGDVRDCYDKIISMDFDGIGLDFLEGKKNLELIRKNGFPEDKTLFAGLVNGKNIWKCNYEKTLSLLRELQNHVKQMVLSTSCSLLHVPYTLDDENILSKEIKQHFSFALEKLRELLELGVLVDCDDYRKEKEYRQNIQLFEERKNCQNNQVRQKIRDLTKEDFIRKPERSEREKLQKKKFALPLLPTTTIGSFPQTQAVKKNRSSYRKGEIDKGTYDKQVLEFIQECIQKQEEIGLDVLVHGEYERNDMVEFFGENLDGYVFTQNGWVQSYGTRCVKPPIIYGDIRRVRPITVEYSVYAKSLTQKPVKGMLTGPVTILNWSFPREDISLKEMAYQIGIAIREEVLDLEKAGIHMIQIDEAALKEKLPLRREDWYQEYLDWAIPAFRLCHSGVKADTQIHTHMCYSEFNEIIKDIDNMDADVISFEASRSKLTILDAIKESGFETEVGPGVYDIHSPRIPSVDEIVSALQKMLTKIDKDKLWVNPDCGLKTRGNTETEASLKNLVKAAKIVRDRY